MATTALAVRTKEKTIRDRIYKWRKELKRLQTRQLKIEARIDRFVRNIRCMNKRIEIAEEQADEELKKYVDRICRKKIRGEIKQMKDEMHRSEKICTKLNEKIRKNLRKLRRECGDVEKNISVVQDSSIARIVGPVEQPRYCRDTTVESCMNGAGDF